MAATAPKTGPKTLYKVREAIEKTGDKKGASIVAIKNYILATWPDTNPSQLKSHLKKAIEKGFEQGLFKRPKSSEAQGPGLSGSIMLNKEFIAAEAKTKVAKEKLAEKKAEKKTTTTVKKTAKKDKSPSRSKSRSSSQSPAKKPVKKAAKAANPKTTKTDTKSKSKAKSPKKAPKAMAAKKKILQSKVCDENQNKVLLKNVEDLRAMYYREIKQLMVYAEYNTQKAKQKRSLSILKKLVDREANLLLHGAWSYTDKQLEFFTSMLVILFKETGYWVLYPEGSYKQYMSTVTDMVMAVYTEPC